MARSSLLLGLVAILAGCGGAVIPYRGKTAEPSALERAAQEGNLLEVPPLLAFGIDPNASTVYGSPLDAAVSRPGNAELVRALIRAGANSNGRERQGKTCWVPPLVHGASMDLENTRVLLNAGAEFQHLPCSRTVVDLLHLALAPSVVAPFDGIQSLIQAGVPVNARDVSGKTPLALWQ